MGGLSEMKCEACRGDVAPLNLDQINAQLKDLPGWALRKPEGTDQLIRVFTFKDFSEALRFTLRIGELAEAEDHHPTITTEWGKVTLIWWTHKINGLHLNDFIMAAKSEQLYNAS